MGADAVFERALKTHIYQLFPPGKLRNAALYALFSGGKRLRPRLVYLFGEALGVPKKKLTILASSLEMIHNYTLIHDDLPAMDDDDFRRGKPSLHRKFDEATAILVGDALLTQAFELLSDLKSPELSQFVAHCVGARGVIQGQMLDLGTDAAAAAGTDTLGVSVPNFAAAAASVPYFLKTYHLKTAKLFEASIVGPWYLSQANQKTKKQLLGFADLFGLCFQIADDLEDAQETNRKKVPTLAKVLGVKKAKSLLEKKLFFLQKNLDEFSFALGRKKAIKNLLQAIPLSPHQIVK